MVRRGYAVLLVLVLTGWGSVLSLPAQARTQPQSGPSCDLLDDPSIRGRMSAAFELALLQHCGRFVPGQTSPTGRPVPAGMEQGGPDVRVNAIDPPAQSTVQSETSIALDMDSGVLCATYNDIYHYFQGQGTSGFSRSTDGGLTWQDGGAVGAGGGGVSRGDPSVAWRRIDGHFYYASLQSSGGGLNLGLWRSTDDCATFEFVSLPHSGDDDKEFMAIDNYPASPYYGRFYIAWVDFAWFGGTIRLVYSDDGVSWNGPVDLSTPGDDVQGAWPAVAPNGDVYVGWVRWNPYPSGPIDIEIVRSTDGGTSFNRVTNPLTGAVNPRDVAATTNCNRPALKANPSDGIRYLPSPQVTAGPDGCLHVVYSYDPDGYGTGDVINVYYRRSCDHGMTWAAEVLLNDDGGLTDQFYPTLTVSEYNIVGASWYDRRLDPSDNYLFDRYMAVSYDGGLTWGPNERVSDVSSPVYIDPSTSKCYHGDYDQMTADIGRLYILWSDDRVFFNGHYDPDIWFDRATVRPDFSLELDPSAHDACRPAVLTSTVRVRSWGDYSQPVTLSDGGVPAGVDTAFTVNPVDPLPGTSTYSVTVTNSVADGTYAWPIVGDSPTRTHAVTISLVVNHAPPVSPTLISPPDGAVEVPPMGVFFQWSAVPEATWYHLQVDDDPAFASPEVDVTGIRTAGYTLTELLASPQTHYWRVSGGNGCGEGSYSTVFSFTTRALCILLVDDDQNGPNVQAYYTEALDFLGLAYDVWDVGVQGDPTSNDLLGYPMVLWFTGAPRSGTFSGANEEAVAAYLDSGGSFFLSSEDYLTEFFLTPFGRDYLGIYNHSIDVQEIDPVGNAGDPIGDGLGPYTLVAPPGWGPLYTDYVDAVQSAPFRWQGSGRNNSTDYDSGTFRTVFLAWPLEALPGQRARGEVLEAIVHWFGWCGCEAVHDVGFTWEPITPTAGQVVTFTGWASGTEPITYSWGLEGGRGKGAVTGYRLQVAGWKEGGVVTYTYGLPGEYAVVMTATNCGTATATAVHTVTVLPEPCEAVHDVDFIWVPITPTAGQEVAFTGAASGTLPITYTWDFGDGSLPLAPWPSVTHTYDLPGAYAVVLTATNCQAATATAVHTVTVLPGPCEGVGIVTVTQVISGCAVTFGSELTGTVPFTFSWDFGPFGVSTETNPVVDFGATGTYTGTLEVWNCGGAGYDLDSFTVQVNCTVPTWRIYLPVVLKGGP